MQFTGFASIPAYERECARFDLSTERRAYHKGDEKYFVLITRANHPGPTEVDTWHLFTADESAEIMRGIIPNADWLKRTGGVDVNFTGLLSKNGYFPDGADAPAPAEIYADVRIGDLQQFSFFA